jgi:hypothetical protein
MQFVDVYGALVFAVEYNETAFNMGCAAFKGQFQILFRDLQLVGDNEADYAYKSC